MGSGPAPLAIAIALLSNLRVTALDSSREMHALAMQNVQARGLPLRVIPVIADVHAIPVGDGAFDLVVSLGSYHFWQDLPTAFTEILRVMKPGGTAYIGGGAEHHRLRQKSLPSGRSGGSWTIRITRHAPGSGSSCPGRSRHR
ncbi:class I SAM-dependent methyltransferase [Methanoregula sp.]|uniref:class I SAM-dependent methyltransferase n=1 Tax=Methanoregula sp. TaxID=2052170 RepID=UPI003C757358